MEIIHENMSRVKTAKTNYRTEGDSSVGLDNMSYQMINIGTLLEIIR